MSPLRPIVALVLVAALFGGARGEDERDSPTASTPARVEPPSDVTRAHLEAIDKGLEYLASCQSKVDGSFNEQPGANIAVTSLALLAFMAGGHTVSRGRHSQTVSRGVDYLLRHVTTPAAATSEVPAGYVHLDLDEKSRMHGHGYATLVLALACGTSDPRPGAEGGAERHELREKLRLAVSVIERSQDDSGGWGYYPVPPLLHEGSVTVCQVQALRAAREAGIPVKKERIDRAIRYLERSQDPQTGGFCYSLTVRDRQTFALTAAALSTLFGLGEYGRDRMVKAGLEFMDEHSDASFFGYEGWFYYANLYAAQTYWQAAAVQKFETHWRRWWPRMRDHLVSDQRTSGYWSEARDGITDGTGRAYATACACLILSVPLEILPLFQR